MIFVKQMIVQTLKSCMLKVLMKLPLLSFTAMEDDDL